MAKSATPTNHNHDCCPIARASQLLGDLWTILIVKELLSGPKRYGELNKALNATAELGDISSRTLSQRLKFLEQEQILVKTVFAEVPPRTEYHLTERGQDLSKVVNQLRSFGEKHLMN
jgi:DNA-binding HxlR family transcriptional regulator